MRKKIVLLYFISFLFLAASILLGFFFGSVIINPFNLSSSDKTIFFVLRFPRVVLAGLTGAMLSVSGAIFQSVLKNPLADPYILSVSAGGAIGAAIAMVFGLPIIYVCFLSFLGAVFSSSIVYFFSKTHFGSRTEILVLMGVALSSLLGSILVLIIILGKNLNSIYFWLFGTFSFADYTVLFIAFFSAVLGIIFAIFLSERLNILLLSDEEAKSLGIDVEKNRLIFIGLASFLAAVSVSLCGIIGFVGLVVPHIIRFMVGANNKYVIPFSSIFGASFLILSDLISRSIFSPIDIPIGITVAFVGAPFLFYLVMLRKNV